jgi:NADH-quinone oxidoreductase subunit G
MTNPPVSSTASVAQPVAPELVELTIDDQIVRVPKGTNIIQAAATVGSEVPYYCYHPHLSVPANCRICQVEVEGAPKLMVACHTPVAPNMKVRTHKTSEKVRATQAATMELLLINHPLDCTVCDQAGHCKLQDYHYEYNAKGSRFLEQKVHKPKAVELGPTVMLDAERCIACTRCVRFCDEQTKTGELGLINRTDHVEISIRDGKPLNNPFSGTVVDLCPVGALTHRRWRFKTRIWFTTQTESICPGCSTGCNVKVAARDGEIVQVKARLNSAVNKEWLCDEGRYGFDRFLPKERILLPRVKEKESSWEEALQACVDLKKKKTLVFVAPDLLLEEYNLIRDWLAKNLDGSSVVALGYRERPLSDLEKMLISPDYAANAQGAIFAGLLGEVRVEDLEASYSAALNALKTEEFEALVVIGDRGLAAQDLKDLELLQRINSVPLSVGLLCDESSPLAGACTVVFPVRSILEKQGLLINRTLRLQYNDRVVNLPEGPEPSWRVLEMISTRLGNSVTKATSDRELTLEYLARESRLPGLRIKDIKGQGFDLGALATKQVAA